MSRLVFVDETKAKSYVMAAVSLDRRYADAMRRSLKALILPGQTSLHMRSESERRRRHILGALIRFLHEFDIEVAIYDAGVTESEIARRSKCLRAIVAANRGDPRVALIIDRDETLVSSDRQTLIEALREEQVGERVHYEHVSRRSEQLLAMPDVFAWCWNRGGLWRQAIRGHVSEFRILAE